MALFRKALSMTHAIFKRYSHDSPRGGYVGENLPFQIENSVRLLIVFCLFFGSASSLPFLLLRDKLKK